MQYQVEYTDTFGGEANYSWARRATIEAPANASNHTLLRRARKALGLEGVRGRVSTIGEILEFRPYGCCAVLFVTPEY